MIPFIHWLTDSLIGWSDLCLLSLSNHKLKEEVIKRGTDALDMLSYTRDSNHFWVWSDCDQIFNNRTFYCQSKFTLIWQIFILTVCSLRCISSLKTFRPFECVSPSSRNRCRCVCVCVVGRASVVLMYVTFIIVDCFSSCRWRRGRCSFALICMCN